MWPTIDRARRRLGGGTPDPAGGTGTSEPEPLQVVPSRLLEDVVIVVGRVELDRLRLALQRALGDAVERPDTPERLARALSLLLARRGLPGRPTVLRLPAGISTPESWELHLDGVEPAIAAAVRDAGRTGRFGA